MNQWRPTSICVVLAVLIGLSVWGLSGLTKHAIVALDRWGDAAPDNAKVDALLSQGLSATANADRAAQNLADATGDWSDASKQQARDVRAMLAATGRTLDGVTEDAAALKSELNALHQTTDAATGLTVALTGGAQTADRTIAAAQPLLASYTTAGDSLNRILTSRKMYETLDNIDAMTINANGILADGRQVADKAHADYLKPVPWWKQPVKRFGEIWDVGAAVARHTP